MSRMLLILCVLITAVPTFAQSDCVKPSRFNIGDTGMVTPGAANNVRAEPTADASKIGAIGGGKTFDILGAPVCDASYVWIQLQAGDLIGWTVEANADDYWVQPVTGEIYADDYISLMIPSELAEDVTFEILPEEAAMGGIHPIQQYLTFRQEGDDGKFHFPGENLNVVPADAFTEESMPIGADAVEDIQLLLYEQPEFNEMILELVHTNVQPYDSWFPQDPFILGAKRMLVVSPHYVDMANGRGVAFITMYAQDLLPVTKKNVFYNFIGLTDDERYLVTMQYPVQSDMLIDSIDYFIFPDNWADSYRTYIEQATESLNTVSPDDWQPSINTLDAVVNSIYITGGFEN